ncbi:MAG: hypothetical protein ACJ76I_06225 [Gaiellaceae bacterium]
MESSPYTAIEQWRLPQLAVAATLASVVGAGRRGDEAGVFWLGERSTVSSVRAVVSLRGRGVLESSGLWTVSSEVYGVVSRLAREHSLTLLGTAHTHARGVRVGLSYTDRRDGVRVPDFLAVVIGNGGADRDPKDWSFNIFETRDFRELLSANFQGRILDVDEHVDLWRANADGASEWSGLEDE